MVAKVLTEGQMQAHEDHLMELERARAAKKGRGGKR